VVVSFEISVPARLLSEEVDAYWHGVRVFLSQMPGRKARFSGQLDDGQYTPHDR
jgi:hypothetical protein